MESYPQGEVPMEPLQTEERRRWRRLRSHLPVRYQDLRTQRFVETLSKDISVGGVQCLTHEFLPANRELLVEIALYRGTPELKARARVAWIQQVPHADQYCMGLEFLSPPDELLKEIHAYIETASATTVSAA